MLEWFKEESGRIWQNRYREGKKLQKEEKNKIDDSINKKDSM